MRKDLEKELEEDLKLITVNMRKADLKNIIYDLKTKIKEYERLENSSHSAIKSVIKYTTTLYKNLESQLKRL